MNEPTRTPGIDELRSHASRLINLLDDPHPGLITWKEGLATVLAEIGSWDQVRLSIAAQRDELRAACKAAEPIFSAIVATDWQAFSPNDCVRVLKSICAALANSVAP